MTSLDNSPESAWLAAARDAAAAAAAFIAERAATRHDLVWEEKSDTDFVSAVDIGAEERIRDILMARLPGLRIVGEELGPDGDTGAGFVAVVDPLDGTTNFLHGFPAYGVSICLAVDGVPRVGVVHDVARGGVYWAVAGHGAWRDATRLHVSTIDRPARALIGTGFPFKDVTHADQYVRQIRALMPLVSGMRRAGSAALDLCDVANGRFDGFWELNLNPWDFAAGILLVQEAGGVVTRLDGRAGVTAGRGHRRGKCGDAPLAPAGTADCGWGNGGFNCGLTANCGWGLTANCGGGFTAEQRVGERREILTAGASAGTTTSEGHGRSLPRGGWVSGSQSRIVRERGVPAVAPAVSSSRRSPTRCTAVNPPPPSCG